MACPFFSPTHRADDLPFPHPARLPLGGGWRGHCSAPEHERSLPADGELEFCNLGYARNCPRFPKAGSADAIRFGVAKESQQTVLIQYVFEVAHQPGDRGVLEYDRRLCAWLLPHPETRIQNLAQAFLQSYLERRTSSLS